MNTTAWKSAYPVRQSEEHRVSRRQFAKVAGCAVAAAAGVAAGRGWLTPMPASDTPPMNVAGAEELPIGGYKLFRYPSPSDPCILVRLGNGELAAYGQSCTHLMCPVYFEAGTERMVCACHEGFFSARDGRVLAGPPPRPLPRFQVRIVEGRVWVGPFTGGSQPDAAVHALDDGSDRQHTSPATTNEAESKARMTAVESPLGNPSVSS